MKPFIIIFDYSHIIQECDSYAKALCWIKSNYKAPSRPDATEDDFMIYELRKADNEKADETPVAVPAAISKLDYFALEVVKAKVTRGHTGDPINQQRIVEEAYGIAARMIERSQVRVA